MAITSTNEKIGWPQSCPDRGQKLPDWRHYNVEYMGEVRVFSFAHQLREVLKLRPGLLLEVGAGTGIVSAALKRLGIKMVTLDIERTLQPDLLAEVTRIPVEDRTFDVALCCQVLEHLPLEYFVPALRELRRVLRGKLIMSLPDATRYFEIGGYLPRVRRWRLPWSVTFDRRGEMPKSQCEKIGHYWEIGYKGTRLRQVRRLIEGGGWKIERTWRVSELPLHRFFRLV